MGTVAFQTLYAVRVKREAAPNAVDTAQQPSDAPLKKPMLLGTCKAYAPDSPVVARQCRSSTPAGAGQFLREACSSGVRSVSASGVQALGELRLQCGIHQAAPGDTALAGKAIGYHEDAVMRLPAWRRPGMTGVLAAVIAHLQQRRGQGVGN